MSVHLGSTLKKTAQTVQKQKLNGEKITMLTSYDFTLAHLIDAAGVDMILVGDSAANVMLGHDYTLPITVNEMIVYARGVVRAAKQAMVVVDMPFGSYQISEEDALRNAVKVMKETGCDALKLEGGEDIVHIIKHMTSAGIPIMGHLGLTPQSVHKFGGYSLRAKQEAEAEKLMHDALLLQEAGCFSLVLEKIPATLAKEVTEKLTIPVIGIGAGNSTDGQVLVLQDMLGMNDGFKPKFLRHFAQLGDAVKQAAGDYINAVRSGDFPNESESY